MLNYIIGTKGTINEQNEPNIKISHICEINDTYGIYPYRKTSICIIIV